MAAPSPKRRRSWARARALAFVFSTIVHLAIVTGLLWQARWRPAEETPDALQVELSRQPADQRRTPEKPPHGSRRPASLNPSLTPPAPRPVSAVASPTPPAPSVAPPPPARDAAPGLSQTLRRSLACAHPEDYGLTSSEREDCQIRAAKLARAAADGPSFGLSPQKQAVFEAEARRANVLQEPFLAERPKQGCKPTVTEHEGGVVGRAPPNWTASVACAIRF